MSRLSKACRDNLPEFEHVYFESVYFVSNKYATVPILFEIEIGGRFGNGRSGVKDALVSLQRG
jgi:hypothetical protein